MLVEEDEIRKPEKEIERKRRREVARTNGYKDWTWSSLEESRIVLRYTWL